MMTTSTTSEAQLYMTRLFLLLVALFAFLGCDAPVSAPLPEGACPVCRGEGTITTTEQTLVGMSADASGFASIPVYDYKTEVSPCEACHGTGEAQ